MPNIKDAMIGTRVDPDTNERWKALCTEWRKRDPARFATAADVLRYLVEQALKHGRAVVAPPEEVSVAGKAARLPNLTDYEKILLQLKLAEYKARTNREFNPQHIKSGQHPQAAADFLAAQSALRLAQKLYPELFHEVTRALGE